MIKGRYELKIQFDIQDKRPRKELRLESMFADSTEFIASLMSDLQDAGLILDKFVPVGKTDDAEVHI